MAQLLWFFIASWFEDLFFSDGRSLATTPILRQKDFKALVFKMLSEADDLFLKRNNRRKLRRKGADTGRKLADPFIHTTSLNDQSPVFQQQIVIVVGHFVRQLGSRC